MKRTDKAEIDLVAFIASLGLSDTEIRLLRSHIEVLKFCVEVDTTEKVSNDIFKKLDTI